MKLIRSIIALAFATALAGSAAFADSHGNKPEAKPAKATCGCVVQKDGKVCGVDSDCCCTGEKAKGKQTEAAKEKIGAASACCAPDAGKEEKADKAEKAKAAGASCEACAASKLNK